MLVNGTTFNVTLNLLPSRLTAPVIDIHFIEPIGTYPKALEVSMRRL